MRLAEARPVGDVILLRYLPPAADTGAPDGPPGPGGAV
jgi:hypothetical protein